MRFPMPIQFYIKDDYFIYKNQLLFVSLTNAKTAGPIWQNWSRDFCRCPRKGL